MSTMSRMWFTATITQVVGVKHRVRTALVLSRKSSPDKTSELTKLFEGVMHEKNPPSGQKFEAIRGFAKAQGLTLC